MRRTNARATVMLLIGFAAMAAAVCGGEPGGGGPQRDVTFFVASDPHIGVQEKDKPVKSTEEIVAAGRRKTEAIAGLIGKPYPAHGPLRTLAAGNVAPPRGLLIAGDLTDNLRWDAYEQVFPAAGIPTGSGPLTVFPILGNHDGNPDGATRKGFVAENRARQKAGKLAALSENGMHYALNWDGVHVVCVSPCPADTTDAETPFKYGKPGSGSWNDPQGALTFLKDYLRTKVGHSGEPVFVMQHYGFDGFSTNDWNWWTPKQRRAFYDALQGYEIAGIIHGHDHHAAHYRWPDPEKNPAEVQRLFDDSPPAGLRSYDVFSCGDLCWVFRVWNDRLIAAHYGRPASGWNPALCALKPLARSPTSAAKPAILPAVQGEHP